MTLLGPRFLDYLGKAAAERLKAIEGHVNALDCPRFIKQQKLVEAFCTVDASTGLTLAHELRGAAPVAPADDLEGSLLHLARDAYPGLLLPGTLEDVSFRLSTVLWRHPARARFEAALLATPGLGEHWQDCESERQLSTPRGVCPLGLVAPQLLCSAWQAASLTYPLPTLEQFSQAALDIWHTLLQACQGQPASVPVRIGLAGVRLPAGGWDLGWVRLRPADERDQLCVRQTGLRGDWVVLELQQSFRLQPEGRREFEALEQVIDNLRLALILSWPADSPPPTTVQAWRAWVDPLSHGLRLSWADPAGAPRLGAVELSADQTQAWMDWARRIQERPVDHISVAKRRLLRAICERRNPEDVLVDSVIAWENLLGAQVETTMRTAGALAWLLADSPADRRKRVAEYKQLYRLRSRIVHGGGQLEDNSLTRHSEAALTAAVEALRALYLRRPDLLLMRSSEERSNHLLLDLGGRAGCNENSTE